jgi:hypothetical protein
MDSPAGDRERLRFGGKAHFGLAGLYRKSGRQADAAREMKAFEALKASQN